jgi:hypothetical protein
MALDSTLDRAIYERYLADAAGILASCVAGGSRDDMSSRIEAHDRLCGHAWLQDEVYRKSASAWSAVKREAGRTRGG